MSGRRKVVILAAAAAVAGVVSALVIRDVRREQIAAITGVILRRDAEARNQVPVAGAQIRVDRTAVKSQSSGLFRLNLRPSIHSNEPVAITILHPQYETLETTLTASRQLYVFYLKPIPAAATGAPEVTVTNPRVRYAVTENSTANIGSAAETFEVVNDGNIPCKGQRPCSPDGRWKAAIAGKSLDAGDANSFEDARVTCIAGPCPFTRVEKDGFSNGGKHIDVLIRNWSDTTTFLFEAEVTHTMATDAIRQAYPAKFGDALDFTLPATAEGPSIEATVGGQDIVFPLSPDLTLTWAVCSVTPARDGTKLFHCEMKRGYRLQ